MVDFESCNCLLVTVKPAKMEETDLGEFMQHNWLLIAAFLQY